MLKTGEVEVRVEAIGLNFRDVLNAPQKTLEGGFELLSIGGGGLSRELFRIEETLEGCILSHGVQPNQGVQLGAMD